MNTISPMTKQLTLIRREFWEQRIPFLLVPLCCVLLVVVTFGISTVRAYIYDYSAINVFVGINVQAEGETAAEALQRFALTPFTIKERIWQQFYMGPVPLLFLAYWGIMIFYYLSTLYQQRKDRSILFWNSMPVSSTQTVISKMVAGLVISQGIFLVAMLVIQLMMLVIFLLYGIFFDVDLWATFIGPANIFTRFLWLFLFGVINIFWCLPVYAWLLFNSAWAKSAPLVWAVGPFLVLIIPELFIYEKSEILLTVFEHILPTWMFSMDGPPENFPDMLQNVMNTEFLVSVVLGVGLVYAAIRFNRSEDI